MPKHKSSLQHHKSLWLYEGIPELIDCTVGFVKRQSNRNSVGIVTYHLLCDATKAAELAMLHYLTLTLNESFLQKSHIGTPYQKWAKVTNDDFLNFDRCLKSLIPYIEDLLHAETASPMSSSDVNIVRNAHRWFSVIDKEYASCVVNPDEPSLTLSAISSESCIEDSIKRFSLDQFLCVEQPVVMKSVVNITDRSVLTEVQRIGIASVDKLIATLTEFATWLEANFTMRDVTKHPSGLFHGREKRWQMS